MDVAVDESGCSTFQHIGGKREFDRQRRYSTVRRHGPDHAGLQNNRVGRRHGVGDFL